MSNTVSLFVKQILAQLQGDTATAIAAKNERKSQGILKGQIGAIENKIVDAEQILEDAKEEYNNAIFPKELITSSSTYLNTISDKKYKVDKAQADLEELQKQLDFWKKGIEEWYKTVEA